MKRYVLAVFLAIFMVVSSYAAASWQIWGFKQPVNFMKVITDSLGNARGIVTSFNYPGGIQYLPLDQNGSKSGDWQEWSSNTWDIPITNMTIIKDRVGNPTGLVVGLGFYGGIKYLPLNKDGSKAGDWQDWHNDSWKNAVRSIKVIANASGDPTGLVVGLDSDGRIEYLPLNKDGSKDGNWQEWHNDSWQAPVKTIKVIKDIHGNPTGLVVGLGYGVDRGGVVEFLPLNTDGQKAGDWQVWGQWNKNVNTINIIKDSSGNPTGLVVGLGDNPISNSIGGELKYVPLHQDGRKAGDWQEWSNGWNHNVKVVKIIKDEYDNPTGLLAGLERGERLYYIPLNKDGSKAGEPEIWYTGSLNKGITNVHIVTDISPKVDAFQKPIGIVISLESGFIEYLQLDENGKRVGTWQDWSDDENISEVGLGSMSVINYVGIPRYLVVGQSNGMIKAVSIPGHFNDFPDIFYYNLSDSHALYPGDVFGVYFSKKDDDRNVYAREFFYADDYGPIKPINIGKFIKDTLLKYATKSSYCETFYHVGYLNLHKCNVRISINNYDINCNIGLYTIPVKGDIFPDLLYLNCQNGIVSNQGDVFSDKVITIQPDSK